MADPSSILPDSLNLPPHLSAQKYFFVCTLTVAAWDTLVLSPRAWRLFRTKEWPVLKIFFHILRFFMPIEFTIVGVAFFDTKWSQAVSLSFPPSSPSLTAKSRLVAISSSSSRSALLSSLRCARRCTSSASTPFTRRAGLCYQEWVVCWLSRSS